MVMKSESEIKKHLTFLEGQLEIMVNFYERKPEATKMLELIKNLEKEIEIFKWVLNEPSKYGEVKL